MTDPRDPVPDGTVCQLPCGCGFVAVARSRWAAALAMAEHVAYRDQQEARVLRDRLATAAGELRAIVGRKP